MSSAWVAAGFLLIAPHVYAGPAPFDEAFDRLYNFDFSAAHSVIDRYISQHPDEPLPYAMRASA